MSEVTSAMSYAVIDVHKDTILTSFPLRQYSGAPADAAVSAFDDAKKSKLGWNYADPDRVLEVRLVKRTRAGGFEYASNK